MPGERVSGDCIGHWQDGAVHLFAVIDGLGHGPGAARSSCAAHDFIAEHRQETLDHLIRGCGQVLRSLRGAAITLIRIDCEQGTLSHIAIGNVETRYRGTGTVQALTTPGIVGSRVRKIIVRDFVVQPGDLLIIHTDGISSRFDIAKFFGQAPAAILATLLADHAKSHDDAGCVVITCKRGDPHQPRS